MRSIGIDLQRWIDAGLLQVRAVRPTAFGFEEHLAMLHRLLDEHEPQLVVLDAVASLTHAGARSAHDVGDLARPRPAQGPRHHRR